MLGVCWEIEGYVLGKGFVGGREVMQRVVEIWSECVGKVVGVCVRKVLGMHREVKGAMGR